MKVTFEFNLPDEQAEHLWALNGAALAGAISEAMQASRGWLKHGHEFKTPEEAIEAFREFFLEVTALAQGDV